MGSQEHLPLCWSSHQAEVLATFQQLLSEETFVDVTLACEGASLKAHKMILSACSPYFQNLFLENPCKHPIVIMKDVDYRVLKGIVDFMYHGGIHVPPDQLSEFLKTAEALKVKGLSDIRKTTELNSEAYVPLPNQDLENVLKNNQTLNSPEQTDCSTNLPVTNRKQQQSNENNENEEQYMGDESNSFSIVEVKSEPDSNDDVCYEQTVLPDYSSTDVNLSPAQYTVSVPHSTIAEATYSHSINNEQTFDVSSGHQQDIVMKETPPQFSDISTQNTSFTLIQNTSEDPIATHLSSNQYNNSSSVSQYISVQHSIPETSKNQDIKSDSLVPFEEPILHSSNQMCESYSSRNPIIEEITGILEQKNSILDKTTGETPNYVSMHGNQQITNNCGEEKSMNIVGSHLNTQSQVTLKGNHKDQIKKTYRNIQKRNSALSSENDIKPIGLKTFEESTAFSTSTLLNQKFSSTNPVTGLSENGSFTVDKEPGKATL